MENLTKKERRQLKKEGKKEKLRVESRRRVTKKITIVALSLAVLTAIILLIIFLPSDKSDNNITILPPTDMQGHIELSPPSHILDTPMQESIQKHMLEHADGKGAPGVIVQYNCEQFECEDDLVAKLTTLVQEYQENVYLAPGKYNGKIILTKLGEMDILDNFDEDRIKDFIQ